MTKETAKKESKSTTITNKTVDKKHKKEQLLKANKFRNRKALLQTILEDGKEYTVLETENAIYKFMNRKVEN